VNPRREQQLTIEQIRIGDAMQHLARGRSKKLAHHNRLCIEPLEDRCLPSAALPLDLGAALDGNDLLSDPLFASDQGHKNSKALLAALASPSNPAGNAATLVRNFKRSRRSGWDVFGRPWKPDGSVAKPPLFVRLSLRNEIAEWVRAPRINFGSTFCLSGKEVVDASLVFRPFKARFELATQDVRIRHRAA
jgi:hypothetical protein